MKVALLNCADLPETDIDEAPLLGALRAEGVDAETLSWAVSYTHLTLPTKA